MGISYNFLLISPTFGGAFLRYYLYWALGLTCTTICTLLRIYVSKVSVYRDGSSLTVPCTQCTSDTSCAAGCLDLKTLVMGITSDKSLCIIWNQLYQVSRALCDTFAACLTLLLINYRNSIYNVNSPELTYCLT